MKSLSKNQKIVAMALTDDWQFGRVIKTQATKDGGSGTKNYGLEDYEPIQRISWQKLIRLKIAKEHPEMKAYCRGDKWEEFKNRYGDKPTKEGSDFLDVFKSIDKIF